ncbi:MAG: GNAT family N-acetyltransferase [Candidatus Sulfotelmatobacter sp.]
MMDLERQSPAAGHWSRNQYQALVAAGDEKSERVAWVVEDDEAAQPERIPPTGPGILAFLIAQRIDAAWELENIVVAATGRRRGIGQRLLGELIAQVRSVQGREIFLEVRQSNRDARSLYRRAGFEEVGLRRGYYSNPPEDAILCRLRF